MILANNSRETVYNQLRWNNNYRIHSLYDPVKRRERSSDGSI